MGDDKGGFGRFTEQNLDESGVIGTVFHEGHSDSGVLAHVVVLPGPRPGEAMSPLLSRRDRSRSVSRLIFPSRTFRQRKDEIRTTVRLALDPDPAPVAFNDSFADRETDSGSGIFILGTL